MQLRYSIELYKTKDNLQANNLCSINIKKTHKTFNPFLSIVKKNNNFIFLMNYEDRNIVSHISITIIQPKNIQLSKKKE